MRKDYSDQIGQRIVIHSKAVKRYVDVSKITHISRFDSLVNIYTTDSFVCANQQLKEFENELEGLGFIRINRTTIINEAHISAYFGGEGKNLEMTNGEVFSVSRRRVSLLK